jgi:hypothetical protein
MTMTRKGFLRAATGGTILLILQACGGGDGTSTSSLDDGSQDASCGSSDAAITGNHGHVLAIPAADLDSAVDVSYSIQGSASHAHTITLTAAQLQMLKAGQAVTVTSSTTLSHNHSVTASCV